MKGFLLFCILLILLPGMSSHDKQIFYAIRQCKNKKLKKYLMQEKGFNAAAWTSVLEEILKLGLCVTCCTCKSEHSTQNHSMIIAQLLTAGADGTIIQKNLEREKSKLEKGIENENRTFDVFGIIRLQNSLKELEAAMNMQIKA